ncbi:MAG: hypothetical protein WDO69_01210 [Pseudomonadota bacterium]
MIEHWEAYGVVAATLAAIPGRENVRWVALDLSDGYREFARGD